MSRWMLHGGWGNVQGVEGLGFDWGLTLQGPVRTGVRLSALATDGVDPVTGLAFRVGLVTPTHKLTNLQQQIPTDYKTH